MKLDDVGVGLVDYVVWHGGAHDDDCPQDDTCDCSGKRLNDAANTACRVLEGLTAVVADLRGRRWLSGMTAVELTFAYAAIVDALEQLTETRGA